MNQLINSSVWWIIGSVIIALGFFIVGFGRVFKSKIGIKVGYFTIFLGLIIILIVGIFICNIF